MNCLKKLEDKSVNQGFMNDFYIPKLFEYLDSGKLLYYKINNNEELIFQKLSDISFAVFYYNYKRHEEETETFNRFEVEEDFFEKLDISNYNTKSIVDNVITFKDRDSSNNSDEE